MVREVRYRPIKKRGGYAGRGETMNISSSGALFTTEHELPEGTRIKLFISWPMRLNDTIDLKLVTAAVVVRAEGRQAAVRFETHEFRISAHQRAGAASAA